MDYYAWGEDLRNYLRSRTEVRPLGQGGRLALDGAYIYWALWSDGIKGIIDAAADEAPSLADVQEFRIIAAELDEMDVYSAAFGDRPLSVNDPQQLQRIVEGSTKARLDAVKQEGLLLPYQAIGLGAGEDSRGRFAAVVLLQRDERSARENARRLEERIEKGTRMRTGTPWSEIVRSADVGTKGRVLTAKLRVENPRVAVDAYLSFDSLFLSE